MRRLHSISISALALAVILIASACATPAIAPTAPAATPEKPPAAATPAATQPAAATPQIAATPTSVPPSPTKPPATAAPTGGFSMGDLAGKGKGTTEYSFTSKIAAAGGQAVSSKVYVKGTKMRNETTVAGRNAVTLLDLSNKVAYTLLTDQKMAVKMDFSQALSQSENPGDKVGSLPSDAKFVGTDTVDGKSAAIFETAGPQGSTRTWIWTDRGLPLKAESTTPQGKTVVEYTDYQFGSQPDSLFELPPGTQVLDIPGGIPSVQGTLPVPKK